MKKFGIIAMAMALLMGMSQCKKENTTTSNDEGVKVPVTLNVGSNSGSRVAVEGSTGVVTFENGDVIHVVSNGVYVGTMTYEGSVFSGEINEPTEGQKLQFYFLGNKTPEFSADNTGCSVVISDQTEYLPVISYAPSRENYQVGKTDYNATLLNKCALVKFNVTTSSEAATCITGMNNKVTIDFSTNDFAYGQEGEGVVSLAAGNGEKWAILLPQDEIVYTTAYSLDGIYTGLCAAIPVIAENDYLTSGIMVTTSLPSGAIGGLFTVNANGDQVYFSKGNLQYIGSAATPYWKFADHQWDYLGDNGQGSSSSTVDRDLFGFGTSGYNHGAVCYQPWSTSTTYQDYMAYGWFEYFLFDQTGQADWGYNAISNGGNQENFGWRTLYGGNRDPWHTGSEWDYLFNRRPNASSLYGQGKVNGVNGMILLPDEWTLPDGLSFTSGDSEYSNVYSEEQWSQMEANGAVFLPSAGHRDGTSFVDMGTCGRYNSSSPSEGQSSRFFMNWGSGYHGQTYSWRYLGFSVRLVLDAE